MKHLTGKLLQLIFTLVTLSVIFTTAFAAESDRFILTPSPDDGKISVSAMESTYFYVIPEITDTNGNDVTDDYELEFVWRLNNKLVSTEIDYEFYPKDLSITTYTLTCSVTATNWKDGTVKRSQRTWYPTVEYKQDLKVTISQNIGTYYFDSNETQDGLSVYDHIYDAIDPPGSVDLRNYYVTFTPLNSKIATLSNTSKDRLTNLKDLYLTISGSGTWSAEYSVTLDDKVVISGKLRIEIEPYIGMDLFFAAEPGETVTISPSIFEDFWFNSTEGLCTLEYISITSCTGLSGVLCYDHTDNEKNCKSAKSMSLYLEPRRNQKELLDLTFVPSKSNKAGTVTIKFKANGTDYNDNDIIIHGSIIIFYSNEEASALSYDCVSSHVMLSTADFTEVYRAITGSKVKNPSYSIRFLDIPTHGTLYRDYDKDQLGAYGSTALTKNNLARMSFSSLSSATNSLDHLAYVPTTHSTAGDTVRYVAYSGSNILYIGTVTFTSREFIVTYTTTSNVTFSSADFFTYDSPLMSVQYVNFATPIHGTLYRNYENGNGFRVKPSDYFSNKSIYGVHLLDSLTYVPQEGFTGIVEIPFYGTSLLSGSVFGRVRIYVAGNAFEDIDPNGWATPYIYRLIASGIVSGTSATTFSPEKELTYGEALKMILMAAGHPKQDETCTPWAQNYLELAFKKGIVSSKDIDLSAKIDRTSIAEIIAKALGMKKASSIDVGINAPSDTNNGYVYALYNAGILNGSNDANGINHFYGDKFFTRAEIAKVICMINDYRS